MPIVLGHLKPVVVLPAAVLTGLSASQIEAILAHELAHVRRHDYLVNLAQTVVETLLFYHPAVWWVSRQVRDAREHCCDDLAVAVCDSRKTYVHALLGMEELRLEELRTPAGLLALGATDGPLLARARRLLLQPERGAASPRLAASAIALAVVATTVAGVSFASEPPVLAEAFVPEAILVSQPGPAKTDEAPAPTVVQPAPVQDVTGGVGDRRARRHRPTRRPVGVGRARRTRRAARALLDWYAISPVSTLPPVVYMDPGKLVFGDMTFSGHIFSRDANRLKFPGRRLVVPARDGSVKLLFAFDTGRRGNALTIVHGSSLALPVETRDLPIYWLGSANATQSLAQIDRLYSGAATVNLQRDVIAAIGVHDASEAVVAWLERRVSSGDADALRAEATEWIAWHPIARSVTALDRIARGDRAPHVRQEAAEAMGDLLDARRRAGARRARARAPRQRRAPRGGRSAGRTNGATRP